jgi:predicted aspartyl protease
LPQPDVIRGTLDDLNRPFVKLSVSGFPGPLTAFIDTGFNGSLILDQYQAEQVGLQIRSQHIVHRVSEREA